MKRFLVPASLLGAIGSASAEVPAGFAAAVTAYGVDTAAAIGLLIAAGIIVWGAKKLGQKLGLL